MYVYIYIYRGREEQLTKTSETWRRRAPLGNLHCPTYRSGCPLGAASSGSSLCCWQKTVTPSSSRAQTNAGNRATSLCIPFMHTQHVHIHTRTCTFTHAYTHTLTHTHTLSHAHTHTHAHKHTHTNTHTYIYTHIHTHAHTHAHHYFRLHHHIIA